MRELILPSSRRIYRSRKQKENSDEQYDVGLALGTLLKCVGYHGGWSFSTSSARLTFSTSMPTSRPVRRSWAGGSIKPGISSTSTTNTAEPEVRIIDGPSESDM